MAYLLLELKAYNMRTFLIMNRYIKKKKAGEPEPEPTEKKPGAGATKNSRLSR